MKSIKIQILSLMVLTAIWGCEEQLNLAPLSAIGENGFYQNADEVEGGVVAIYDGLQAVPQREFALTEMRSDNTRTRSSEGDWAEFQNLAVQPTNQVVQSYWADNYNVIFRANRVIENLEVVEATNLRTQFEAEARFTRALAHFNLMRAYGDIPILNQTIIQTDTEFFDRDSKDAVLNFIVEDLRFASAALPAVGDIADGRATSGAANALLAKALLWQQNYSEAEGILEDIIASGEYALEDDYNNIFYQEMGPEIIFAIPYLDDDGLESQDFSFEMTVGGRVSGLNYLTDEFLAAMDPEDTERNPVLSNPLIAEEV
ncbi:MAG: RagB/SusD family nutrient uptake outer membrane protein, partial [Bacteroidota bacterium]